MCEAKPRNQTPYSGVITLDEAVAIHNARHPDRKLELFSAEETRQLLEAVKQAEEKEAEEAKNNQVDKSAAEKPAG